MSNIFKTEIEKIYFKEIKLEFPFKYEVITHHNIQFWFESYQWLEIGQVMFTYHM